MEIVPFLYIDVNRQLVTGSLACLLSLFRPRVGKLEKQLICGNLERNCFSLVAFILVWIKSVHGRGVGSRHLCLREKDRRAEVFTEGDFARL